MAEEAFLGLLGEFGDSIQPLDAANLRMYTGRQFVAGWRLTVVFSDQTRRIDLLIDDRFPRSAPRVALVDRPAFLSWPHVERDGVLCLLPSTAAVDPTTPTAVARRLLGSACELIEECISGSNTDDFRQEFLSYWQWALPEKYETFCSLVSPTGPTRVISVWSGKTFSLVADSDQELTQWLANRRGDAESRDSPAPGLLIWLDCAPTPDEYPTDADALLELVRRADGSDLLESLVKENPRRVVVIIGASTSNGPILGGVSVYPPTIAVSPRGRRRSPVQDGFRPGRMPTAMLAQRYIACGRLALSPVERVDAEWTLGRSGAPDLDKLRAARVVVLGCGSVGAAVAVALVQAGATNLALIDPACLKWSNIARHALGAQYVGRNKAEALCEYVRQAFPHVGNARAHPRSWQDVLRTSPDVLASANIIVSAMGDWVAEGGLNAWHVSGGRQMPIVYGWTEPFGCAGHAVAICREDGCLSCGMDNFGTSLSTRTRWRIETLREEPACGVRYQPYGVVALGHIVSSIAEVAIAHITEDHQRSSEVIWRGDDAFLAACGGTWTDRPEMVNSLERVSWERRRDCPTCA